MRTSQITREQALKLLKTYNKEEFHIQHALTVEGVMRWYAKELGYGEEEEYWGSAAFCMILILNYIRKSTAGKLLSFCETEAWVKI